MTLLFLRRGFLCSRPCGGLGFDLLRLCLLGSRLFGLGRSRFFLGSGFFRGSLLGWLGLAMVMAAAGAVNVTLLALEVALKDVAAHGEVAGFRLGEEEVDHLVLVQRGTQLGGGHRGLLDIADEGVAVLR